VSLRTSEHLAPAYIGCDSNAEWYVTSDPRDAFDFGKLQLAEEFKARLKDGDAYGRSSNERLWQVTHEVPIAERRQAGG
jgi:hypothetical protein